MTVDTTQPAACCHCYKKTIKKNIWNPVLQILSTFYHFIIKTLHRSSFAYFASNGQHTMLWLAMSNNMPTHSVDGTWLLDSLPIALYHSNTITNTNANAKMLSSYINYSSLACARMSPFEYATDRNKEDSNC